MKTRFSTRIIVEAGIMLALATILGRIKLFSMGMGGSVTAGSMVPLLLIAMLRGPVVGVAVGAIYGFIDYIFGGYPPVSIIQWLLDYPVAFSLLGLAGFFWTPALRKLVKGKGLSSIRDASTADLLMPLLVLIVATLASILHLGGFFSGSATLSEVFDGDLGTSLIYGGIGAAAFTIIWFLARRLSQAVYVLPIAGAIFGIGLRAFSHILSGVWFFGHYAPEGTQVWVYSLGYNAQYMVPEIIISGFILVYLAPTLMQFLNRRA